MFVCDSYITLKITKYCLFWNTFYLQNCCTFTTQNRSQILNLSLYTSEFRYNLKLAYPVMLGMIGHTLVAFIDNIMVGRLGTAELAAVSLGNSFIFIAMSLGIGFSTAITPLVAEADGEKNIEKGKNAFNHGLFLCTVLGFALFLMILGVKPLMYHMDQPEEVVRLAMPYLNLVAISLIPLVMFQGFKQFADGMSQTKYAMWATILGSSGICSPKVLILIMGKSEDKNGGKNQSSVGE